MITKFVDREEELKALQELAQKGSPLVEFIYGPEGCGKTRLLKEFTKQSNQITIYIDALEREDPTKALNIKIPITIKEITKEIIGNISGPLGKALADSIFTIIKTIAKRVKIKEKHIVIAVDDITRAIGLNQVEWYIKWLYEMIDKLHQEYNPESILIIATTSEGKSLDLVKRHTYATTSLIWNLPKQPYLKLTQQLNPPDKNTAEKTWNLTGGNPRKLIEIAIKHKWNTQTWLKHLEQQLLDTIRKIKAQNLLKELQQIIEDPDNIYHQATPNMNKLYELLTEENLVIYKYINTIDNKQIPKNIELGIGKYYAWQIPAYKKVIERILNEI